VPFAQNTIEQILVCHPSRNFPSRNFCGRSLLGKGVGKPKRIFSGCVCFAKDNDMWILMHLFIIGLVGHSIIIIIILLLLLLLSILWI
jgi:hypothetical protein